MKINAALGLKGSLTPHCSRARPQSRRYVSDGGACARRGCLTVVAAGRRRRGRLSRDHHSRKQHLSCGPGGGGPLSTRAGVWVRTAACCWRSLSRTAPLAWILSSLLRCSAVFHSCFCRGRFMVSLDLVVVDNACAHTSCFYCMCYFPLLSEISCASAPSRTSRYRASSALKIDINHVRKRSEPANIWAGMAQPSKVPLVMSPKEEVTKRRAEQEVAAV